MGFPSLVSHLSSLELLHPLVGLPLKSSALLPPPPPAAGGAGGSGPQPELRPLYRPLKADLPCELHLLNLRLLQQREKPGGPGDDGRFLPHEDTALLLHRLGADCSFPTKALLCSPSDGKVRIRYITTRVPLSATRPRGHAPGSGREGPVHHDDDNNDNEDEGRVTHIYRPLLFQPRNETRSQKGFLLSVRMFSFRF